MANEYANAREIDLFKKATIELRQSPNKKELEASIPARNAFESNPTPVAIQP